MNEDVEKVFGNGSHFAADHEDEGWLGLFFESRPKPSGAVRFTLKYSDNRRWERHGVATSVTKKDVEGIARRVLAEGKEATSA